MSDPFDFERADRYAVMGSPVAHSRSPAIHRLFARQLGQRIEYLAIQVDPGGFVQAVEQFRAGGGKGLNVTLPFKPEAFRFADQPSERARRAGAVNTLRFESDGRAFGDNTDGAGLVRDLEQNMGAAIAGRAVLLLGAGGAARGVLGPLLERQPASLVIANRTVSRAHDLAQAFTAFGSLEVSTFEGLHGRRFDIAVNGTSASLAGEVPALPDTLYARAALAYDMVYGERPTPFLEWSMRHGAARAADGLGMLVEQAAESYFVWRGVRPETRPVIEALRRR